MTREELKKNICDIIDNLEDEEIERFSVEEFGLLKEEQNIAEELIKINGEFKKLTKVVQKLEITKDAEIKNVKPYIDMYKFIVNSINLLDEMPNANYINILKFNTQFGSFKTAYKTIQERYEEILQEISLVPVASVGDEYDSQTQEIISVVSENFVSDNKIIEIIEQGFKYNGELIKYAQVSVGKSI